MLTDHISTIHLGLEKFECSCGKKFRSKGAIFAHKRKCTVVSQEKKQEENANTKQDSKEGETGP